MAFEQTDLPVERILYSKEESQRRRQEMQQAGAQANTRALVQELQQQGLPPEEIQRQLLMLLAQLGPQAGGLPSAAGRGPQ